MRFLQTRLSAFLLILSVSATPNFTRINITEASALTHNVSNTIVRGAMDVCRPGTDCEKPDREPTPRPTATLRPRAQATPIPAPTIPTRERLSGFADLHNHQFANLAFGGHLVVGSAFGPPGDALTANADRLNHGQNHEGDIVGAWLAAREPVLPPEYGNWGWPSFGDWPHFGEVSHQKVYQDWLYRAVQGGLRLMVMFAVESPLLCSVVATDGRDCADEMGSIDLQINAAYQMQDYIDALAGGPGRGWYRIVTTPAQARDVIEQGKLAVVLGIETAHLFDCAVDSHCNWKDALSKYWRQGVRHFYPIHQADTAFGGASYFNQWIQWDWATAPQVWELVHRPPMFPPTPKTRDCSGEYKMAKCNALGLTQAGKDFIVELFRAGALIDLDHMSDLAFADTIQLATAYGYPPVATHVGFNYISKGDDDHEGQLKRSELQAIQRLEGMVGIITAQGDLDTVRTFERSAGKKMIPHTCGRSTETFAQAYAYAIDNAPGMSVALGTDFNGPVPHPGPRFGSKQCNNTSDVAQQITERNVDRLSYPFLARGSGASLPQYIFGARTYDFNIDGLAHIALLPDFIADLEILGLSAQDLDPLLHSAEGYVQVWERAIAASGRVGRRLSHTIAPSRINFNTVSTFSITALDLYEGKPIQADVYLNGVLVGKTDQPISRTFRGVCLSKCTMEMIRRGVCNDPTAHWYAPSIIVRLVAPNYSNHEFQLPFLKSSQEECSRFGVRPR